MKIIYTNLSPISNAYTNLNHIFELKKQNPQKAYICIWDNFVFENEHFGKGAGNSNKVDKLKESVDIIEKLLTHLQIDYKIIYLSEALNRLYKNTSQLTQFQTILSNFTIGELKKGFELNYIPFSDISLSRINYIVADFLVSTYLPELYPELCSSQPTHYLTSARFKVFQNEISHTLKKSNSKYVPPKCVFVTNVPVIIHPEDKTIPALEMSLDSIKRIVAKHYAKKPDNKEVYDIAEIMLTVLPKLTYKDKKYSRNELGDLTKFSLNELIELISSNLYEYFEEINRITAEVKIERQKKSNYITTFRDYNDQIRELTDIKLEILKHCDGKNTSLDIAKKTGLKLSTVSPYLTQLKQKRLIEESKRPKRLIDSFVIDLEALQK